MKPPRETRRLRIPALLAALAWAPALAAGPVDWDLFGGPQLQCSLGLPGGNPSLRQDLNGHLGLGVGVFLGARISDRNAFRLTFDFTGNEVATWYYTYPNQADRIEYKDIWRVFRLGLEHELSLDRAGRVFLVYGGGLQESWVNRTEGSLLEVVGLALAWSHGATSGSTRYSTRRTALDSIRPFGSVGLGWKVSRRGSVEARYLVAPYLRYATTGLSTSAEGPWESALGHRVMLSYALRFGD